MKVGVIVGLGLTNLCFLSSLAQASQLYNLNFDYMSGANSNSSGEGTWFLNDEAVAPLLCQDYGGGFDCSSGQELEPVLLTGLDYLDSFSVTFNDLDSAPNQVTFKKSNLNNFSLLIDRVGNFYGNPSFSGDSLNIVSDDNLQSWVGTVDFSNGSTEYAVSTTSDYPIPEPTGILGTATALGLFYSQKRQKMLKKK